MLDSSTLWLKISYFRLTHLEDLRKWWVIILIALDVFLFVFCITNAVMYFVDMPRQHQMIRDMANDTVAYQTIRTSNIPAPLVVQSTAAIPVSEGKYNLVAKIKNQNTSWAGGVVIYTFTMNGQQTAELTDFILPNTEKYLTAFGVPGPISASVVSASFAVQNVEWQHVSDNSAIAKTNFVFDNTSFSLSGVVGQSTVYTVRSTVRNTGYTSFWRAPFTVVLLQDQNIVGVGYVRFDQFRSGEEKSLTTQVTVTGVPTSVVIVPDINLLDSGNLIT